MTTKEAARGRVRLLAGVTAVTGGCLLVLPHRVARWFSRKGGPRPADAVVQVLGGRQLLQGAVQIARPETDLVLAGVAVDVLHLLSMVALAAAWPTYRRPALVSAAMAGVFAAAGTAIVSGSQRQEEESGSVADLFTML